MPNFEYLYSVKGDFSMDGTQVYLHPENFINFLGRYRYHDKMFPVYLARLQIDANLMDYILKNADTLKIHIIVSKIEVSNDRQRFGPEEDIINSEMVVVPSSNLNFNKELDYLDSPKDGKPKEDAFKEKYIGLVPSECIDANKLVINENIHKSKMQDIVLNYFDKKQLHLLIKPFVHNKSVEQLILPPLDTTYSFLDYLNNMSCFYDTKFLLFFEEPRITYLLDKTGTGVASKDERWNDVIINVRSSTHKNNVLLGMTVDGWTQSYIIDLIANDSSYQIDNTTNKVYDSIGAILNPNILNTKMMEDTFKNLQNGLKQTMETFKKNILSKTKEAGNMGNHLSRIIPHMQHSVMSSQRVTRDLMTSVRDQTMAAINLVPATIIDKKTGLPIPIMNEEQKSIFKSNMDNNFDTCEMAKLEQAIVDANFSDTINKTADQYYKSDFLDNNVRAVTFVNIQDVSKIVDNAIRGISTGTIEALSMMAGNVTPHMGAFSLLPNTLSNMKGMIDPIIAALNQSMGGNIVRINPDTGQWEMYGGGGSIYGDPSGALESLITVSGCFGSMSSQTRKFGNIGINAQSLGDMAQKKLDTFSKSYNKAIGAFSIANQIDIKGLIISQEPLRQFVSNGLNDYMTSGVNNLIQRAGNSVTKVLDKNIAKINAVSNNIIGGISKLNPSNLMSECTKGMVQLTDLSKLSDHINNFNLDGISKLGLNNLSFNLNIGGGKGKTNVGVKLLKVRNDNPNQLKNIKSEVELNKNQLVFHKKGLDCSVFTPNKNYIVNNFIGHNTKDGSFILKEKVIIFAREDDKFSCDTRLIFARVQPETATTNEEDKAVNLSKSNPNESEKQNTGKTN